MAHLVEPRGLNRLRENSGYTNSTPRGGLNLVQDSAGFDVWRSASWPWEGGAFI